MALELAHESIWFDKWRVDDAERQFYENKSLCETDCKEEIVGRHEEAVRTSAVTVSLATMGSCTRSKQEDHIEAGSGLGSLASQIAKARQEIQNSLVSSGRTGGGGGGGAVSSDILNRITKLEDHNSTLLKTVSTLEQQLREVTQRLASLECGGKTTVPTPAAAKKPEPMEKDDDDDEVDLFGSDDEEEDETAARVREERLKAYAEKKAKKPGPIAKSSVLLDCKPWDDETDMSVMEAEVRKIEMDGLTWGAGKLIPLAFGIKKLSILCIVEDEKVSIDDLSEKIQEKEDYVQSVDIAAFNKI